MLGSTLAHSQAKRSQQVTYSQYFTKNHEFIWRRFDLELRRFGVLRAKPLPTLPVTTPATNPAGHESPVTDHPFGAILELKSDWKFPVGAGLPGFLGGPSHFQGKLFSPHPAILPVGLRRNFGSKISYARFGCAGRSD